MLLISAGHQPGQPAPLSFDTIGVTIRRSPGPVHRDGNADDADDPRPHVQHGANREQQPDEQHRLIVNPPADTRGRLGRVSRMGRR
jgi:hypothetical protein